jgi:hypothetical protein
MELCRAKLLNELLLIILGRLGQASTLAGIRMTGYSHVLSQTYQHAVIPADIARIVHNPAIAYYWQVFGGETSRPV